MTYPQNVHPEYARLRRAVEQGPMTFVLLPSLTRELCVAETVRRQMARPFARSRAKEEAVIRERFAIHVGLPVRKIETMRPLPVIVDEMVRSIRCDEV
jgi:shikimate kinase